jgi:membrane protein
MADAGDSRGRHVDSPVEMPRRGWRDVMLRVKEEVSADHVAIVAAGVAFYALLAIFPGIAAIVSIAALVMDPAQIQEQIGAAASVIPAEAASILQNQALNVSQSAGTGVTLAAVGGLLLTLYSASSGMKTLMEGMNIAYNEAEDRSLIRKNVVAFTLTLFLTVGFVLAIGAVVIMPVLIGNVGLGDTISTLVAYLRWPVLALFVMCGLAVLYRFAPSRSDPKWRWVSVGAIIAVILWIVGSIAFSVYVRNFASYNETYGTLGAVIILLMWLWLSAFIILLGAEINSELEAQTEKDTTTGRPLPMGTRGAQKADHLGHVP